MAGFYIERPPFGRMPLMDTNDRIQQMISANPVVLYMKGTPQFPQCGFSAMAVEILKRCGIDDFKTVDVLADADIRQGIKDFSSWPTIPQLYVNSEFVGGADIMKELYESGELKKMLPGGDAAE